METLRVFFFFFFFCESGQTSHHSFFFLNLLIQSYEISYSQPVDKMNCSDGSTLEYTKPVLSTKFDIKFA